MSDDQLRNLRQAFLDHAYEAQQNRGKSREKFIADNPNEPIPDWMDEDFSLPYALAVMCEEIDKLKNQ